MNWRDYQVDIPEGCSGDWEVKRFEMTEAACRLANIRASFQAGGRGWIEPGHYTRLCHRGAIIMSDTPDEIQDHAPAIDRAEGVCRVHGLGLGMVVEAMLRRPAVERVDVVELEQDVIDLVAPTLQERHGSRLRVIQGDVLQLKPTSQETGYNVIWHDIWPTLNFDNLPEMTMLHRRWVRRTAWQGSWGREWLRYMKRRYG